MTTLFPPVPFTPTETLLHTSSRNGRDYRLFISPALSNPGPRGRPLLVVLDGNAYHGAISMVCRSRGFINGEIDEPHVVGIGYASDDLEDWLTRRNLDLTPTKPSVARYPGEDLSPQLWGDNDGLLDMIEQEVIPLVDERHGVDRYRMALFGHSMGGLTVLHALFTRPKAFTSWLSISPSIWWEGGSVLERESDAFLSTVGSLERSPRIFMAVGALEEGPPAIPPTWPYATPEWLAKRAQYTGMVSRLERLADKLRHGASSAITLRTRVMEGETHASAPFAALTPAFDLAFPVHDEDK